MGSKNSAFPKTTNWYW